MVLVSGLNNGQYAHNNRPKSLKECSGMLEATFEESRMALGRGQSNGDEFLAVRFYMDAKLNTQKTENEGRPIYDDVPWIEIMQPGNKNTVIIRPANEMDIKRFPTHWRLWKERTSDAEIISGTPLSEWPGVTRGQVEELSFFNIKTVEQLANMADSNTGAMMGLVTLKQKAQKYLTVAKEASTADALEAANRRIDELMALVQGKVAEAAVDNPVDSVPHGTSEIDPIEQVLAHIAEGNPNPPPKKKRHRRTKAEIEAAKG
jgi:hypothetical protein